MTECNVIIWHYIASNRLRIKYIMLVENTFCTENIHECPYRIQIEKSKRPPKSINNKSSLKYYYIILYLHV